ncbi:ABC transporter ATP-binding protein [Jatrophihabitans sp. YIM 134969]
MVTTAAPEPSAGTLASLRRLIPWLRPYRRAIVVMFVTATGAMLAQSFVPLVIGAMVDGPIARHETDGIWALAGLAMGLGVLEAALFFCRRWAMATVALGVETDVRRDVHAHLQRLPVSFHDRWPSGQLLSRVTSDLSAVRRFVGFGAIFFVANLLTVGVIFVLLVRLQPWLGIAVVVLLLPLIYLTRTFEIRYSADARRAQDLTGDLATAVEESALGIRVIKSYGRRPTMLRSFSRQAEVLRGAELTKIRTLAGFWTFLEAVPQVVLGVVVVGGGYAVVHGSLDLGAFVAFLTLYLRLQWPIISIGWFLALGEEAASATRRIFEVLDSPVTIADPAPAAVPAEATGVPAGRLEFDGVRFRYPDADHDVLSGIDLVVEDGETVALVGATGSGKTTLTSLVPRLHDVSGGAIRIGGVDVREFSLDDLRHRVATAFEEPTLFSASVRENVTLGRPDATDADVAEAVEVAQAGFVFDLPFGLETRIGEQGLSLSGGQRQRLALARAVLGRPPVLVLDDPLSALDVHTEELVEAALRRVLASSTALVVAHRPSTVALADRVALLQGGRITAVGTHQDLLRDVPAYRDLLAQESDLTGAAR